MFIPGTFKLTWLAFATFVIGIMTAEVMDALLRGQISTFINKHPVHAALTIPLNLLVFLLVRRQLHIVRADRQRAPSERERVRV